MSTCSCLVHSWRFASYFGACCCLCVEGGTVAGFVMQEDVWRHVCCVQPWGTVAEDPKVSLMGPGHSHVSM